MLAPRSLSVLVVDDHPDTAESLTTLLGLYGHRATVAHTAGEALAAADRHTPDVALLDIHLPDLDGWQVARWLKELAHVRGHPAPLVVAVTGCGQEKDYERSVAAGIDFHLVKPVDPEVLVFVLAACRAPVDDRGPRPDGSTAGGKTQRPHVAPDLRSSLAPPWSG